MIIKSFTAESAAAALKKVRFQMGGDAVVLKTRQLTDGNGGLKFEVTALLDSPSVAQTSDILTAAKKANAAATRPGTVIAEPPASESRLTPDVMEQPRLTEAQISPEELEPTEAQIPAEEPVVAEAAGLNDTQQRLADIEEKLNRLFAVEAESKPVEAPPEPVTTPAVDRWAAQRAALRDADVPEVFINELIAKVEAAGDTEDQLTSTLESEVRSLIATDVQFKPGDRLLFIGLPASGKTSAMGKLAARLVLSNKRKIKLMTLDNFKIGALDEIHSYGELLGVDVGGATLAETSAVTATDEIVMIDSPGVPVQSEKRPALLDRIAEIKPTYCFVAVDVMVRASDTIEFIESIKEFGPTHMIATKTDLTNRQGSVIAACHRGNIKLAFQTDSPGGIGSLRTPDAASLTRMLLGETAEVSGE